MWSKMSSEFQANFITVLVVLTVGVLAGIVLAIHNPALWVSAVAIGCGISSVGFAVLALRIGARKH